MVQWLVHPTLSIQDGTPFSLKTKGVQYPLLCVGWCAAITGLKNCEIIIVEYLDQPFGAVSPRLVKIIQKRLKMPNFCWNSMNFNWKSKIKFSTQEKHLKKQLWQHLTEINTKLSYYCKHIFGFGNQKWPSIVQQSRKFNFYYYISNTN